MELIFFNIGWMEEYRGQTDEDKISGGHRHIQEHGEGHEQYNFLPYRGFFYGYAPVQWNKETKKFHQISIENLGANQGAEKIDNILVIFISKSPFTQKTYIVGWYKNATVYRYPQKLPSKKRMMNGDELYYICKSNKNDVKCLKISERIFVIPTAKDGGYGQNTIWYAEKRKDIQNSAIKYITKGILPYKPKKRASRNQIDQKTKKKIEDNAVKATKKFYENIGFKIDDVSKDNCGWDLTVYNSIEEFFIEVKGTRSNFVNLQLTPNEYLNLKIHCKKYKISAVTNCLRKPKVDIFSILYDEDNTRYIGVNDKGLNLILTEKTEIYAVGNVE